MKAEEVGSNQDWRMSGGITQARLAEERKAWRKNHPHVSHFLHDCVRVFKFKPLLVCGLFVFLHFISFWKFFVCRVLWRGLRRVRMVRLIWGCGIASSLVNQTLVSLSLSPPHSFSFFVVWKIHFLLLIYYSLPFRSLINLIIFFLNRLNDPYPKKNYFLYIKVSQILWAILSHIKHNCS